MTPSSRGKTSVTVLLAGAELEAQRGGSPGQTETLPDQIQEQLGKLTGFHQPNWEESQEVTAFNVFLYRTERKKQKHVGGWLHAMRLPLAARKVPLNKMSNYYPCLRMMDTGETN